MTKASLFVMYVALETCEKHHITSADKLGHSEDEVCTSDFHVAVIVGMPGTLSCIIYCEFTRIYLASILSYSPACRSSPQGYTRVRVELESPDPFSTD